MNKQALLRDWTLDDEAERVRRRGQQLARSLTDYRRPLLPPSRPDPLAPLFATAKYCMLIADEPPQGDGDTSAQPTEGVRSCPGKAAGTAQHGALIAAAIDRRRTRPARGRPRGGARRHMPTGVRAATAVRPQVAHVPYAGVQLRVCPVCGLEFAPRSRAAKICSAECREENHRRTSTEQQNREFSDMTVYLVHKYIAEGESVEQIMEDMGRSRESVLAALAQPLTPQQQRTMNARLMPRRQSAAQA